MQIWIGRGYCVWTWKKKQKMRGNGKKKGTIEEILNVLDYAGCVVLIFFGTFFFFFSFAERYFVFYMFWFAREATRIYCFIDGKQQMREEDC